MALATVIAVSGALTGCALLPSAAEDEQAAATVFAPGDRQAAPPVQAETIDGGMLALADLPPGPVVVNFWASWCGPCLDEAPHLNAVARTYAADGVSVVGVNSRDDRVNANAFAAANLEFPSWYDPEQAVAAAFGSAGPVGLPTTLVLDADRRVAVRFLGSVTGATLGSALDDVLTEADAP